MATSQSPRVVITGLGATTPLGGDVQTSWQAALAGVSGAGPLTQDWVQELDLPVTFAAQLAVPAAERLTKVETRRLDPSGQFALIAAREA
ncbi:MAG: beta-ketoacyl synthase N-terminal-like domain-containing protein, partial [Angustibacter sp.]